MNFKENRKILVLLVFLILLFMSLIFYLSYFTIFLSADIKDHHANRRDFLEEAAIKRGTILDRNGDVLAYSDGEQYKYERHYTYPIIYSHVVGYSNKVTGKAGIESKYNKYLLGEEGSQTLKSLKSFFNKKLDPKAGDNVVLTTHTGIQQRSRDLLDKSGESGAIVTMNPKTGEILSLVSYPDFNSQTVDKDQAAIVEQNKAAFYNRATQSLFPPGSTFKIVTAAGILENDINQNYKDTGEEASGGHPIRNSGQKVYGEVDLNEAFTFSVNTYFANKAMALGKDKFGEMSEKFMFNKKFDFDLSMNPSKFEYKNWDKQAVASAGIGQGDVLATPLQMCMVASTIANGGNMMKPYIVSSVVSNDGTSVLTHEPEVLSNVMNEQNANLIRDMMVNVVNKGSGKSARIRRAQVAGKTGTAQKSSQSAANDAWFVGFAPADDPQICVAVVIQNVEDYGGKVAAPIAANIIDYALRNME